MKSDNGAQPEEVGEAAYRLLAALRNEPLPEWSELNEDLMAAWTHFGNAAIQLTQTATGGVKAGDLAKELRSVVATEIPWEELSVDVRLIWEAVTRGVFAAVDADEWDIAIDVETWKAWLANKKEQLCPTPQ